MSTKDPINWMLSNAIETLARADVQACLAMYFAGENQLADQLQLCLSCVCAHCVCLFTRYKQRWLRTGP